MLLMLDCDQTVTLLRHVESQNTDAYEATVMAGCSWDSREADSLGSGGESPNCQYTVMLPEEMVTVLPQPGDIMALGAVPGASSREDLAGVPHFRVSGVFDRRRGVFLRHVKVVGA